MSTSDHELLRKLCADGLARYTEVGERAVRDEGDPREVFARFMHDMVDSKTSSLVRHLAGLFIPTEELCRASAYTGELNVRIFTRAQDAGVLRPDITVHDMTLAFELVDGVTVRDEQRTIQLRHRYMTMLLDGMRPTATTELAGPPPKNSELSERWEPNTDRPAVSRLRARQAAGGRVPPLGAADRRRSHRLRATSRIPE